MTRAVKFLIVDNYSRLRLIVDFFGIVIVPPRKVGVFCGNCPTAVNLSFVDMLVPEIRDTQIAPSQKTPSLVDIRNRDSLPSVHNPVAFNLIQMLDYSGY
jgi:hypothetical protein